MSDSIFGIWVVMLQTPHCLSSFESQEPAYGVIAIIYCLRCCLSERTGVGLATTSSAFPQVLILERIT